MLQSFWLRSTVLCPLSTHSALCPISCFDLCTRMFWPTLGASVVSAILNIKWTTSWQRTTWNLYQMSWKKHRYCVYPLFVFELFISCNIIKKKDNDHIKYFVNYRILLVIQYILHICIIIIIIILIFII